MSNRYNYPVPEDNFRSTEKTSLPLKNTFVNSATSVKREFEDATRGTERRDNPSAVGTFGIVPNGETENVELTEALSSEDGPSVAVASLNQRHHDVEVLEQLLSQLQNVGFTKNTSHFPSAHERYFNNIRDLLSQLVTKNRCKTGLNTGLEATHNLTIFPISETTDCAYLCFRGVSLIKTGPGPPSGGYKIEECEGACVIFCAFYVQRSSPISTSTPASIEPGRDHLRTAVLLNIDTQQPPGTKSELQSGTNSLPAAKRKLLRLHVVSKYDDNIQIFEDDVRPSDSTIQGLFGRFFGLTPGKRKHSESEDSENNDKGRSVKSRPCSARK